jgi:hypothetical protein
MISCEYNEYLGKWINHGEDYMMEDVTPDNIDRLLVNENYLIDVLDKDATYEEKREYLIEQRRIAWYEEMNLI